MARLMTSQTEMRNLTENWSKDHFSYALAMNLEALCPCLRYMWNFELDNDDLWYLVEEISKQQTIQDVSWLFLTVYVHMCEQKKKIT